MMASTYSGNMILVSTFCGILGMIVHITIYMLKHHKTNKRVVSINKDIKKLAKEIDNLGITDNIDKIEYMKVKIEDIAKFNSCIDKSVQYNVKREKFFEDLKNKNFKDLIDIYITKKKD